MRATKWLASARIADCTAGAAASVVDTLRTVVCVGSEAGALEPRLF